MIVAGIGFRKAAGQASLRDVLARLGQHPDALATAQDKAEALRGLAVGIGLAVQAIAPGDLRRQSTLTRSDRVNRLYGTGSLAEAAALAAAGPGSRLLGPRIVSVDGMATAALAETADILLDTEGKTR